MKTEENREHRKKDKIDEKRDVVDKKGITKKYSFEYLQ